MIFTRYLAAKFFKPFLFSFGVFILLIFLGNAFDRINYLINDSHASLGIILEYLCLDVPYWALRTLPMATLLATLVALTAFIRSGEWIAFQAAGFEPKNLLIPMFGSAILIAALAFAGQELILPACDKLSQKLWYEKIYPKKVSKEYSDITLMGDNGELIQAQALSPQEGRLIRPIFTKTSFEGETNQLDAQWALWDPSLKKWILHKGITRAWGKEPLKQQPFDEKQSDLTIPPLDLIPRTTDPDRMSLRELLHMRKIFFHFGLSLKAVEVAASEKFCYPLANIIICLLGIPIAMRLQLRSRFANFALALVVSFLYLWFAEIGRIAGEGGLLPPFWAVFLPHGFFAVLAVVGVNLYAA